LLFEIDMNINTHDKIDRSLCGEPVALSEGGSVVRLKTSEQMAADASGLVHGGFVFGMADYAAMLAVNHPNVVLGAAQTRFLKPVRTGEVLEARAQVQEPDGKKIPVRVEVLCEGEPVFTGEFTCFTPGKHVLTGQ
jgi:acyl-coenzyme A thioesterase PaaI-like protein